MNPGIMAIFSTVELFFGYVAHAQPSQRPPDTSSNPVYTSASYIQAVLERSPEVRQTQQSFSSARHQWLSALGTAALPAFSVTGTAYPYGQSPFGNYAFHGLRLNHNDMGFTTAFNWTLFNSFQDYFKVRSSSLAKDSAKHSLETVLQGRALEALRAFYDLTLKRSLREVTAQNLAAQEEQYHLSQDLYRHGLKSLADLLKSETDWRSAQFRLASAETGEKAALLHFNLFLDRGAFSPADLKTDLEPGTTALPVLERDLERSMALRPEILKSKADLEKSEAVFHQSIQSNLTPSLTLSGNWTRQDLAAVPSLVSYPNPNYQLFVGVSLPLNFNLFSQTHNVLAARADKLKAEGALGQTVRQVRQDVYEAFIRLEGTIQEYGIATLKESIAHRSLNLVLEQYRQGAADAIRLAQAQLDYLDARVQKSQALHDIFIHRAEYRVAIGESLWQ